MKRRNLLVSSVAVSLGLAAIPTLAADTTLRIASVSGPQHHHNVALRWFADQVEKRDVGLELRVLDGAQLGGERDYIEGMMLGSIEMAQVSTGPIAAFVPEFDLFSLPYLFEDTEHFVRVIEGPVGERMFELLEERGIKGLAWFDNGYRNVFNSKRPVTTPEDMQGLKIRVMESPLMVDTINAMGGAATPMAYGELYTALQQGVLDGAENAPGNVLNDKFFEVADYYSLTHHFRPPGVVAISLEVWNRLSPEQQAALEEEAQALQTYEIALTQEVEQRALEELEAAGMQINEADREAFREAVQPVYEEFKSRFGPELIELVEGAS